MADNLLSYGLGWACNAVGLFASMNVCIIKLRVAKLQQSVARQSVSYYAFFMALVDTVTRPMDSTVAGKLLTPPSMVVVMLPAQWEVHVGMETCTAKAMEPAQQL